MREGMNLVELAKEIQRQSEAKRDFIAPANMLWTQYEPETNKINLEVPVNDHTEVFTINSVAQSQFATYTGIPAQYVDRMRNELPELLTTNMNAWLRKPQENVARRMVRTLDGVNRAFLSDRYASWIDNSLALTASFPVFERHPDIQFKSLQLTEKRFYLQAVFPRVQGELKKGDVVQAGVVISNSEVGWGSFTVERLLYILSCANGAIRGEPMGRRHLGRRITGDDPELFYKQDTLKAEANAFQLMVRDHIELALDEVAFAKDVEKIKDAQERDIKGDIPLVVEVVGKRVGLQEKEKSAVLDRIIRGGDLSQWGVSQAITNVANDHADYDRVVELERIGGSIIDLSADQWSAVNKQAMV